MTMDQPDHRQAGPPPPARDGSGKFTRGIETAERDADAARLRISGYSYRQIATELGWADHTSAMDAVRRALRAVVEEPAEDLLRLETQRLDQLTREANEILAGVRYVTNPKGVVEYDGVPVIDDGPKIAAINTLLKISESRRKLLGLDAEQKVNVSGEVKYEVVGIDAADLT